MSPLPPSFFLLFTFLSLRSHVAAAKDSGTRTPPPPPPPPPLDTSASKGSTVAVIIILIVAVLFLFAVFLRKRGYSPDNSSGQRRQPVNASTPGRVRRKGVDPAVVSTFPTLVYSDIKAHKIGKGALECAVCLSEFEDDEMLRLLPKCDHVYHPECIDQWLESHITCPVCRVNLSVVDDHPFSHPPVDNGAPELPRQGEASGPLRLSSNQLEIAVVCEEDVVENSAVAEKGFSHGRSRSATPAVGRRMEKLYSDSDRERFSLLLPDYIRREVFAGNLSRSSSLVFSGVQSSRRGYRRDGEGTSRDGGSMGLTMKGGKRNWATRSEKWPAFLSSFNWRSGLSRGDVEASKTSTTGGGGEKLRGRRERRSSKGQIRGSLDCIDNSGSTVDYYYEMPKSKDEETMPLAKV